MILFAKSHPLQTIIYVNNKLLTYKYQIINIHYQIRRDWTLLRDKVEYEIMERNAQSSQIYIRLLFCKRK